MCNQEMETCLAEFFRDVLLEDVITNLRRHFFGRLSEQDFEDLAVEAILELIRAYQRNVIECLQSVTTCQDVKNLRPQLAAWLCTCARRKSWRLLDQRQGTEAQMSDRDDMVLAQWADHRNPGGPEDRTCRDEFWRRIHEVLARLDEMQREILLLVHVEQLSNVEAARVMGHCAGTFRTKLHRARLAFKRVWELLFGPLQEQRRGG
jgi:RNA polymerase sigma-70 factor (ECF subfamily)